MRTADVARLLALAIIWSASFVFIRVLAPVLGPVWVATARLALGGAALLPFAAFAPVHGDITPVIVVNVLLLALVCSAVAYLLYFRLIADVGPTRAMTVTFLMPAFGMLWGHLFLDETITLPMLAGAASIVGGTAVVLQPRRARYRPS
ncbi:MAG TPA: DMT family transporter [Casimicrobiaceae bacterium]